MLDINKKQSLRANSDKEKSVLTGSFPAHTSQKSPVIHKVLPEICCFVLTKNNSLKTAAHPVKSDFSRGKAKLDGHNGHIWPKALTQHRGKRLFTGRFILI